MLFGKERRHVLLLLLHGAWPADKVHPASLEASPTPVGIKTVDPPGPVVRRLQHQLHVHAERQLGGCCI